jgi:hypothetical protein
MNTIKSLIGFILFVAIMVLGLAITPTPALAIDTTAVTAGITNALTDVETVAVAVLTVLAGIWAIRKLVKLTNRS